MASLLRRAGRVVVPSAASAASRAPAVARPLAASRRALSSAAPSGGPVKKTFDSQDGEFEAVRIDRDDNNRRAFSYFVLGSARFMYASAVRLAAIRVIATMSASADVLALSSVEVDVSKVAVGSTITVKWRGKPVFIRRRSEEEVAEAAAVPLSELRDPQADRDRAKKPEVLVVLGVCTHLGCVPISNAGEYKGWFCPCHGSHYDNSGRIRKGPAPLNLEVPQYDFISDDKVRIG